MAKKKEESGILASDFNLHKITTAQLEKNVEASIAIGQNLAVFGRRGSGKTEICKQKIKESGFSEVYINLSVMERVDLGGYPDVMASSRKEEFVSFLLPKFYEPMINGDKKIVILYDEVDKADPSLWAPLLEIVQFKSINGKKLPNLQCCLMTGNLIAEGGNRPSLPLLDRSEKYLVEPSASQWLEWASREGKIHPAITAYINDKPNHLYGSVEAGDNYADPSPRSWVRASTILTLGEKNGWSPDLLMDKVKGCVGKTVGLDYDIYYKYYHHLSPLINELFAGTKKPKEVYSKIENNPGSYMVACMVAAAKFAAELDKAQESKNKTKPMSSKNVSDFFKMFSPEMILIAFRTQVTLARMLQNKLDEGDFKEVVEKVITMSKKI